MDNEQLIVWAFDGETREYLWPVTCQPDPRDPGQFIKPIYFLTTQPPVTVENEVAVARENAWEVEPDFREHVYFDASGEQHVIEEIGQVPQPDWTTSPPLTLEQRRAAMIVKRGQGRIILHEDGLLETVENFVNSDECPMVVKIAYQDATDWMRLSTTTAAMMTVLGLSDEQADDLFVRAALVEY